MLPPTAVILNACTAAAAAIALAATAATPVAAYPANPCTQSWAGPDVDQDSISCPSDAMSWVKWLVPYAIGPVLCLILMLLLLIGGLFFCCCRYCCCGGSDPRPDTCCGCSPDNQQQQGSGGSGEGAMSSNVVSVSAAAASFGKYRPWVVILLKVLVVVCLLLSVAALVTSFAGVGQTQQLPQALADGVLTLFDWILSIAHEIVSAVPLDAYDAFKPAKDAVTTMQRAANNSKKQLQDAADSSKTVLQYLVYLCVPTAITLFASLLGSIAALCRIRLYLPVCALAFVLLLSTWSMGVLAATSGLLKIPLQVWCDEMSAWEARQPGIIKNFVKPKTCEKIDFKGLADKLNAAVSNVAAATCKQLAERCSEQDYWNPSDVNFKTGHAHIFKCDPNKQCSTMSDVATYIAGIVLKRETPGTDSCELPCTIQKCADQCTNSEYVAGITITMHTKDISRGLYIGSKAIADTLKAIADVLSKLSCDDILDRVVAAFGKPICDTVYIGATNVYAGAAIGVTVNSILVFAMFWGQKRFFSASEAQLEDGSGSVTKDFPMHLQEQHDDDNISMSPVAGDAYKHYEVNANDSAYKELGIETQYNPMSSAMLMK